MKKIYLALIFTIIICFSSCINVEMHTNSSDTNSHDETGEVNVSENTFADSSEFSNEQIGISDDEQSTSEEISGTDIISTQANDETTVSNEDSTEQSSAEQYAQIQISDVDLNIKMPKKNGSILTDKSADNKFIKAVCETRRINSKNLVAVFSVPESGQNYVFEFKDSANKSVKSLDKVYLLDENCKITGVASSDNKGRENISAIENWFCMNVLIKGIVFPAVENELS